MRVRTLIVLLAVSAGAIAKTALLEHVPLQWKPTSELQLGATEMSQTQIQFESFQDARDNKEAIGENLEDKVSSLSRPRMTSARSSAPTCAGFSITRDSRPSTAMAR
jgi:hypothetical protein